MGGHGGGAGELGVGVHPAHGVGHAIASGAGGHVVGMQGPAGAAAGGDGEVLLALLDALLLVGAGNGVLEPGGVGGVAGDGHVHALVMHDGNALADVVSAVAADGGALTVGVLDLPDDVQLAGVVVELGLDVGKAVDAADDLGGVLAQAVQDDPQGLLAGLVGVADDADGALGGGEGLVAGQEGKALGLIPQQHGAQVAVAQARLAVLGHGAGDAEGLQALADGLGGLGSGLDTLLQCDGSAHAVCTAGVLEADGLHALDDLIGIETGGLADVAALFNVGNSVLSQDGIDLIDSSLVAFKQSHNEMTSPFIKLCLAKMAEKDRPFLHLPRLPLQRRAAGNFLCLRKAQTFLLLLFLTGVDVFGSGIPLTVMALGLLQSLVGVHALLDALHHLAQVDKLVANDLVVLVQGNAGAVALGHLHVAGTLDLGGVHGAHLRVQALAQVLHGAADGQAALGERGLGAAIDDLQEQLPHGGIDGVAHQIGVQRLQNGLADEDLRGHGGGMGHAGAADGLHQSLLDDAVLHVQGQLAGTLLGSTPANTVGQAGDVLDFLGLDPFALFGDGSGTMVRALGNGAHILHFGRVDHVRAFLHF